MYVRLERGDVSSIALQGSSFSKVCENADGTRLKSGEWIFTGDDLVQLSRETDSAVLFTVRAWDAEDTLLEEGTFLYDAAQEKLFVTIPTEGVTCSTSDAPGAAADVPPVLTLPILDEIDADVTVGTAGSSLSAVRAAVRLLDWGVNTGLDADEISDAASTWLAAKNDALTDYLQKLEMVDAAYQALLTDEARELLDSAGGADVEITVRSAPGEGSTFTVTMPLRIVDNPEEHLARIRQESDCDWRFDGRRVLLAEDNELNAEIATALLQNMGAQVDTAAAGVQCIDMLQSHSAGHYDLILMDIQMPNLNGYDAARKIRALPDPVRAGIPIVAMTANAFDEDKRNALDAGMNAHVAEPIDIKLLARTCRSLLGDNPGAQTDKPDTTEE